MMARTATPPTTPPAIAPTGVDFFFLPGGDVGVDEGGDTGAGVELGDGVGDELGVDDEVDVDDELDELLNEGELVASKYM
jgi:hypothetical protein